MTDRDAAPNPFLRPAEAAPLSIHEWLAAQPPASTPAEQVQRLLHFHTLRRQHERR